MYSSSYSLFMSVLIYWGDYHIKAKKSPINVNMLINVRLNDVEKKK